MLELLAALLPLMLAAAANPAVVTVVLLTLTASERPLARATAFVAGFAIALVAVGIVGLVLIGRARERVSPGGSLAGAVDIALGVGLLVLGAIAFARRGRTGGADRLLERFGPGSFVAVGAVFMVTDASALAAYAPLLREIAVADVTRAERAIALALSDAVIIAPVAAPVVVCVLAPRSADRALAATRRWLDRYGWLTAVLVFGAIGAYLLIRGITRL
jgi:hypothetical protein